MPRAKKTRATIVWITPAAIEAIGLKHFGDTWRQTLPVALEMSYSQFHRYMTRIQDVPKTTAMALIALDKATPETRDAVLAMGDYVTDAAKAEPIKYVPVKKERPAKPDNDAPAAGFEFGPVQTKTTKPAQPVKATPKAAPAKAKAAKAPAKKTKAAPKKGASIKEDAKTSKKRADTAKKVAATAKTSRAAKPKQATKKAA